MSKASKPPVFVVGCPRSGTTLLYHILLSSGGFAVYRTESNAFNLIGPRYGDLRTDRSRRAFLDKWLASYKFTRTGLDPDVVRARILAECRSTGDFLRIVMEAIAEAQRVDRWADCTPTHALHLDEIRAAFPDAKIIHMVRDGRDAALSLAKLGWINPFPWDHDRGWIAAGLFWKWMVEEGRKHGARIGGDYVEIRFEDLVGSPHETAARIGQFLDHEIDYDRVLASGIGSVSEPNTSFGGELNSASFDPLGRWRNAVTPEALASFEAAVGDLLADLGYERASASDTAPSTPRVTAMRALYPPFFSLKQWVKARTPLSPYLTSTAILEQSLPGTV